MKALWLLLACLPVSAAVTYNRDVAPILYGYCAPCHRPGESGPFSLLSYSDAKRRARQIADVTAARYMPPWPPEEGQIHFEGERRLTAQQIATLRQWAEQGTAEGNPKDLPPLPQFTPGWQLGPPDLVLTLPKPFLLPAGGGDVFRNFVLHFPGATGRYVRAVEIRPGDKRVVHHANLLIDKSGSSRIHDGVDGQPGFPGMDLKMEAETFDPDSHFLFWKPGSAPVVEPESMSWRLDKGTDLVLNVHLQPSGKPESVQPSIGLYFTDRAPTQFPMLLQLEHDSALDIPPGTASFAVTDHLVIPIDVKLLGIYPHAHYLGKVLEAWAVLPDGLRKKLIRIPQWSLNWQAVYRLSEPVSLPKGSRVEMRYVYDNSDANPANPNHPPLRVKAGDRSSDEMAHLWIQVLPEHPDDRLLLQEALMRRRLEKVPSDFTAHYNLGALLQARQQAAEAEKEFQAALAAEPRNSAAHNSLGAVYESEEKWREAASEFQKALAVRPDYGIAHYNLANTLAALGELDEAAKHYREFLKAEPDDANCRERLATVLTMIGSDLANQGRKAQAAQQFRSALEVKPDFAEAQRGLQSLR